MKTKEKIKTVVFGVTQEGFDNGYEEVHCPECKNSYNVEPDAYYNITCRCGVTFKVRSLYF